MKATKPPRSRLRPRTVGGAPAPMGTTSSSEVGLRILPRSWPLSYNSDPTCFSNINFPANALRIQCACLGKCPILLL